MSQLSLPSTEEAGSSLFNFIGAERRFQLARPGSGQNVNICVDCDALCAYICRLPGEVLLCSGLQTKIVRGCPIPVYTCSQRGRRGTCIPQIWHIVASLDSCLEVLCTILANQAESCNIMFASGNCHLPASDSRNEEGNLFRSYVLFAFSVVCMH